MDYVLTPQSRQIRRYASLSRRTNENESKLSLHTSTSVCSKTDPEKVARVDSAIEGLYATVERMQAKSPTTNATLNRDLSLLHQAHNALVNINTFPEELLRTIFVWFSNTDISEKMRIANTCLRWRKVCLAFPDFWADFTAADGTCGLVDKALSHARGLPLTICMSDFDHHWPAVVLALGLHGDAIRTDTVAMLRVVRASHRSLGVENVLSVSTGASLGIPTPGRSPGNVRSGNPP